MSQSPKSIPSAVLQPNRNYDFKVPFAPGLAKSSEDGNNWRQSPSLSIPNSPCRSPLKQELNDENCNPDKALQPVPVRSALQMDTPGKHLTEICSKFASLQLYTPDSGYSGKSEETTKSLKTKLPFSESFAEASKVCEELAPAGKEFPPTERSTMTLVITDDDEEYFMDASEYLDCEGSYDQVSSESSPQRRKTIGLENTVTFSEEAGTDQLAETDDNVLLTADRVSEIDQLKFKESEYNCDDQIGNVQESKEENKADVTNENFNKTNEPMTCVDKTIDSCQTFGGLKEPGMTNVQTVYQNLPKSATDDKCKVDLNSSQTTCKSLSEEADIGTGSNRYAIEKKNGIAARRRSFADRQTTWQHGSSVCGGRGGTPGQRRV